MVRADLKEAERDDLLKRKGFQTYQIIGNAFNESYLTMSVRITQTSNRTYESKLHPISHAPYQKASGSTGCRKRPGGQPAAEIADGEVLR